MKKGNKKVVKKAIVETKAVEVIEEKPEEATIKDEAPKVEAKKTPEALKTDNKKKAEKDFPYYMLNRQEWDELSENKQDKLRQRYLDKKSTRLDKRNTLTT